MNIISPRIPPQGAAVVVVPSEAALEVVSSPAVAVVVVSPSVVVSPVAAVVDSSHGLKSPNPRMRNR